MVVQLVEAFHYKLEGCEFQLLNPGSCAVALGSIQPLTNMSIRNIYWGGTGDECIRLTILLVSCADFLEMWEPWGLYRPALGLFQ